MGNLGNCKKALGNSSKSKNSNECEQRQYYARVVSIDERAMLNKSFFKYFKLFKSLKYSNPDGSRARALW